MSLDSIKRMYSDKVRAIVYLHLFGNMSDTKEILEFCKEKNIAFIEDADQSLGASLNGVKAGSIGDISTLSFNANKVVVLGLQVVALSVQMMKKKQRCLRSYENMVKVRC